MTAYQEDGNTLLTAALLTAVGKTPKCFDNLAEPISNMICFVVFITYKTILYGYSQMHNLTILKKTELCE